MVKHKTILKLVRNIFQLVFSCINMNWDVHTFWGFTLLNQTTVIFCSTTQQIFKWVLYCSISILHMQVSLDSCQSHFCCSWGFEQLQKSKDSLKACFEYENVWLPFNYMQNYCNCTCNACKTILLPYCIVGITSLMNSMQIQYVIF